MSVFSKQGGGNVSDRQKVDAIDRSQAVIEFALDGTILTANPNFLNAVGYKLEEIQGQHHRMFVDPAEAGSEAYQKFWERLGTGRFYSGEFRRFGKDGREVWLQATYNPLLDRHGKPVRVIKFATDITETKNRAADMAAQVKAIRRAQAVIEFSLDGIILDANANFCTAMGYRLDEIKGQHHRMFVEAVEAGSDAYRQFWEKLRAGEVASDEFKRIGKDRKEVWIQASYNPVFNAAGEPVKVIKFATDITERKRAEAVIGLLRDSLCRMAQGDLGGQIEQSFSGQYEELRRAFNSSLEQVREIVMSLKTTAGSLRTATGEILTGANDLSERTTRQAATVEETSATMERLAATVSENAQRAEDASKAAEEVSRNATEGGRVMTQATGAMGRITESSEKISSIIGMIDDIAFQTNLLALNASVEAARAGEAGKGFAVVAVEVRRLAQSAAEASTEVKALVEKSGVDVNEGAKLVSEVAERLNSMLDMAGSSSSLVGEIAKASRSQSQSIHEVSTAIRSLDELTQQNAALVEETNAAIEQTEGQASSLDQIVAVFTLGGETAAKASPAPAAVPRAAPPEISSGSKSASARYLTSGNAAVDQDWAEF